MENELQREINALRKEIRVLHEAAALTADMVFEQFEQTELQKQRYQEAALNLEGFKRTLDQTTDCVFLIDPETFLFTYVNHGGVNQSGYSAEELYNMTFADLGCSMTREKLAETLAPLVLNPRESILVETTHKRKNGVQVPVEIFVQFIPQKGGKGKFFSIVRNISRRLLEEKEKEQMQAKMLHTQKLESVGELAAGIAHEINTPIQYIGTNLSFLGDAFTDLQELVEKFAGFLKEVKAVDGLQEKVQENIRALEDFIEEIDLSYLVEELPEAISQASDGVERVSRLVLAMKEFSHPGAVEKAPADINQIIETTVQIARHEWKYSTDIQCDFADNLPAVACHSNDIGQVILNLLLNAIHSIQERLEKSPNTEKGLVVISTCAGDGCVTVKITDNGCGIPDEIKNKIFDPFFTTKEVGKGTGQGLAIARNVIQNKHDGEIEVFSQKGAGSTFVLHLPHGR